MQKVHTTRKQVNPIVLFNNILHANIPLFQLVFVETLHHVICALQGQIRDNVVLHVCGHQFQREVDQNVREDIPPHRFVNLGFLSDFSFML